MACGSCRKHVPVSYPVASSLSFDGIKTMSQETTLVRVKLNDNNIAGHPIYGPATKTYYGYRAHGEVFRVKSEDFQIASSNNTWILFDDNQTEEQVVEAKSASVEKRGRKPAMKEDVVEA